MSDRPEPYVEHTLGYVAAVETKLDDLRECGEVVDVVWAEGGWWHSPATRAEWLYDRHMER